MPFRATAYQKTLEDGGFDRKQAYALAAAQEEFVVSELVTKEYLDAKLDGKIDSLEAKLTGKHDSLRAELRSEMAQQRADFRAEIAILENKLIRWIVGTVAGTGLALFIGLSILIR